MIDGRALAEHVGSQIFKMVIAVFGLGLVFGGIGVCVFSAL